MKETGLEKIDWPVLRFGSPNCTVLKYFSSNILTKASSKTLETWRRMDEYFLIDSRGRRYNLREPEFIDPPEGIGKLLFRLSGSARQVRWRVEDIGVISNDQIRELVFENFKEYETVWQAYDLDELKSRITSANNAAEILAAFG